MKEQQRGRDRGGGIMRRDRGNTVEAVRQPRAGSRRCDRRSAWQAAEQSRRALFYTRDGAGAAPSKPTSASLADKPRPHLN